jgi:outer membrane murein-binding lipoprotein Lpp
MELNMKTKSTYGLIAAALLTMGLIAGCANPIYDGRLAWEDGWREGTVTAVGEGSAFAEKLSSNCKNVNASALQSARYATITHKPVTGRVWLTVPITSDASVKINDLVYVNVRDCSKRVERRKD